MQTTSEPAYGAWWRRTNCSTVQSAPSPKSTSSNRRPGTDHCRTTACRTGCRTWRCPPVRPFAVACRRRCTNAVAAGPPNGWSTRRTTQRASYWYGRRTGRSLTGADNRPPPAVAAAAVAAATKRPRPSPTGTTRTSSERYWSRWPATRPAATWWWTTAITTRSRTGKRAWAAGSWTTGRPRACSTCRPITCSTRNTAARRRASKSWPDTCSGWTPSTGTPVRIINTSTVISVR